MNSIRDQNIALLEKWLWKAIYCFGRHIKCSRGLLQGDPLSLYLFILAIHFLTKTLKRALSLGHIKQIGAWQPGYTSLQYVNDTLLPTDHDSLVKVKFLLNIFELLSGLCINF